MGFLTLSKLPFGELSLSLSTLDDIFILEERD